MLHRREPPPRRRAAAALPSLPIRHKQIICEPLLERISLSPYLGPQIERVLVGGESGPEARVCDYDWVLDLRAQCREQACRSASGRRAPASERTAAFMRWNGASSTGRRKSEYRYKIKPLCIK
ncbi:MAG: DUF5131 family protein [Acutalibacteraceae bacterium]